MEAPAREVIDFHVHCYPDALAARAVAAVQKPFNFGLADGTLACQRQWMADHAVRKAAVLNMAGRPDTMARVNSFALSLGAEDPMAGNMIPFGSVHPRAENAIAEAERLYSLGIRGIKLHTGHQDFNLDDPRYLPLYRRIGQLGMVTLVHCGPSAKTSEHLVWPSTVARVIEAFDGAPFICAHMGGIGPEHPEFSLLAELPVLVDTALATRYMDSRGFGQAVGRLGAERVLFGSDLPWGDYHGAIALVEQAPLTREEKDAIFRGNAEALIRRLRGGN